MNWADYCILGVLALSVLIGLWRGLVAEVMALACWAAAFWVAWMFGEKLAAQFTSVDVPSVRLLLGYGLCFIGVLVAGALVAFIVRKLVAGSGLSGTDRLLGMFFGLARGLALVMIAVLLLGFTPFPRDPWWQESRLMPGFQNGAEWLSARLPESVSKHLDYRGLLPLPALQGRPAAPNSPPPAEAGADKKSSS
ncbi:MAG TPA: CvpA family protein [Tahibacter sp.]|uniref:CvpA family protein n=1 Tax=Tahibacter sp. TaxID=2056211 RepID=UPI002BE68227|nr:CvpA family protein [Tahibacter sp.]HSX60973.1 CvpA family protein [Tahibacter sp.]